MRYAALVVAVADAAVFLALALQCIAAGLHALAVICLAVAAGCAMFARNEHRQIRAEKADRRRRSGGLS